MAQAVSGVQETEDSSLCLVQCDISPHTEHCNETLLDKMDILENISNKLDNIWRIFDSALKECDADDSQSPGSDEKNFENDERSRRDVLEDLDDDESSPPDEEKDLEVDERSSHDDGDERFSRVRLDTRKEPHHTAHINRGEVTLTDKPQLTTKDSSKDSNANCLKRFLRVRPESELTGKADEVTPVCLEDERLPRWITHVWSSDGRVVLPISLPLFPVPKALLTDQTIHTRERYLWEETGVSHLSQTAEKYLCERCGLSHIGSEECKTCTGSPQTKGSRRRSHLKQIFKSVFAEHTEDRNTSTAADEGERWSEDDLKKALRKVEKNKMSRSQACQLYSLPFQMFLEYERQCVIDKNNKQNKTSGLKKTNKNLIKSNDIQNDIVKTEHSENPEFPSLSREMEGSWSLLLMEEPDEPDWSHRPVKKIKLEKKRCGKSS